MLHPVVVAPALPPPALLRTELPTIVRERCVTNDQVAIWMAIRWLLAEGGTRQRALSSRTLAPLAKCSVETVQKHLAPTRRHPSAPPTLIELGLLIITGYEDNGGRNRTPIYEIPTTIELENAAFTLEYVQRRARSTTALPSDVSYALLIHALPDRVSDHDVDRHPDQGVWVERNDDQGGDQHADQGGDRDVSLTMTTTKDVYPIGTPQMPLTEHEVDRKPIQGVDRKPIQGVDRNADRVRHEGMQQEDEGGAHTRTQQTVEQSLALPSTPPNQQPVLRHPHALWDIAWGDAHARPAPAMHHEQLANLIAEWDMRSDGFGVYWVARAILEASYDPEPPGSLRLVRWLLRAWADGPSECWGVAPARGRGNTRPTALSQTPIAARGTSSHGAGAGGVGAGARQQRNGGSTERGSVFAQATQAPSRLQIVGLEDVHA